MKVLWIIPGKEEGSSFIFSRRQVRRLMEMGVSGKTYFLHSRTNLFSLIRSWKEAKKIIDDLRPDIIHAHYGSVNGFFALRLRHPKTIITFHGSDINDISSVGFFRKFISKKASDYCLQNSVCNIIVNEDLKNKVPEKYRSKTFVIPMGVDENVFKPMPRGEAKKMLGWNLNEKVVLFNGNDPVIKRKDIAEKAIEYVKKQLPEARLEVLNGSIDPEKIPWLLNASDVLLLCSDSEGSPMMIKEAMACNLPIVSTIVGDTQQRLEHVDGAILTNQNPEDISEKIIEILSKNTLFNLRESFLNQKLSEQSICNEVIRVYEKIHNNTLI